MHKQNQKRWSFWAHLAVAAFLLGGNGCGTTSEEGGGGGQVSGGAEMTAKVKLVKNFPLQVVDLLKQYLTTPDYIFRGDLYLQLCKDSACKEVVTSKKVLEGELFSTGFWKDITVSDLPEGTYYARFGVDTKYSQQYDGSFDKSQNFGPMDILQISSGVQDVEVGKNPPAGTIQVQLSKGTPLNAGEVLLGHILFEEPAFPPPTEQGYFLVAGSGTGVYRNHIKVLDLEQYSTLEPIVLRLKGKEFEGDICGFVRGQGDWIYVIAVGAEGAYVFPFNTKQRTFANVEPVLIPHPDYKGGEASGLDPEKYPWPCRGVAVQKGEREFLYLIAFKGAGSLTNSAPYPLVIVETTGMTSGATGKVVATLDQEQNEFFSSDRILRGAATDGQKLFLLEASWSKLVEKNTVYAFSINDDGTIALDKQWDSGTAEDTCDSTSNWVPAITVVSWGGSPKVVVGNDDDISVYQVDGTLISKIDTTKYGRLITSFSLSPDGKVLYAMPNCKSASVKAKVLAGVKGSRVDLDRHAIVEVDLTSNPENPVLLHTDRDFDADGTQDGGIDLEFLYLKASLLRWCESCLGVVPPTAYTGPELAAGSKVIALRGTGIQSDEKNSSGLGQVADIGIFDLATGKGIIFRDYQVWLDGPSSRWGFDLNPSNPAKDYTDDISTAAILWVPK
jgi:hypothetical protein